MRMLAPAAALSAAALLALPASPQTRVNAPVAPDTIYVARHGPQNGPGISVIDLIGFGQSTGDPTFSFVFGPGSEGQTKFPWNPVDWPKPFRSMTERLGVEPWRAA